MLSPHKMGYKSQNSSMNVALRCRFLSFALQLSSVYGRSALASFECDVTIYWPVDAGGNYWHSTLQKDHQITQHATVLSYRYTVINTLARTFPIPAYTINNHIGVRVSYS